MRRRRRSGVDVVQNSPSPVRLKNLLPVTDVSKVNLVEHIAAEDVKENAYLLE